MNSVARENRNLILMNPIVTLRAALLCAIANVKSISTLRRLSIEGPSLTDADLASLASVTQLEKLSFESLDLADARLPQLHAFSFLKSINFVLCPKGYPLEIQSQTSSL